MTHSRAPRLGEMVYYHENVRQDIWEPLQLVTWPAIVTSVLAGADGTPSHRVRLTAFRPFDKPLWDVTADFADAPQAHHWTWAAVG